MDVPFMVLADYANVSVEGKLNIMGIFTNVFAPSLPFTLPQMQLVFMLRYELVERGQAKNIEIQLTEPDGGVLVGLRSDLQIPGDAPLTGDIPQIIGLAGVTFVRYGPHAFHVLIGGEPKNRVTFTVTHPPLRQEAGA